MRELGLNQYIKLPRFVVYGFPGVGKSSIVESIVGLDFLPIYEDPCTRRPLELKLIHLTDYTKQPWGVFPEEIPGRKLNMQDVKTNITRLTNMICGKGA